MTNNYGFELRAGYATTLVGASALAAEKPAAAPIVIAPPPAGQSQVVFFPTSAMGMAISCNIRENGAMLGTTNNDRYWVHVTTPGKHTYTTKSEATDVLNIEAEPDETQYVKCKIAAGIMAGRPNLSPSTQEEFNSKSGSIKPSDPEKMAKAIANDLAKQAKAPTK